MKFQFSDYAKNMKNESAIVYPDSCGPSVLLTKECFQSEQEFEFWKSVSDEDYRNRERGARREKAHTISLGDVAEINIAVLSAEEAILLHDEHAEEELLLQRILFGLQSILSGTQLRRLRLHVINGMPVKEIAAAEQVILHPQFPKVLSRPKGESLQPISLPSNNLGAAQSAPSMKATILFRKNLSHH